MSAMQFSAVMMAAGRLARRRRRPWKVTQIFAWKSFSVLASQLTAASRDAVTVFWLVCRKRHGRTMRVGRAAPAFRCVRNATNEWFGSTFPAGSR